jgi:hypothetical protein
MKAKAMASPDSERLSSPTTDTLRAFATYGASVETLIHFSNGTAPTQVAPQQIAIYCSK